MNIIISALVLGLLLIAPSQAYENNKGYSTLPGFSAGYRYWFDLDDDKEGKIRLFGKYKQVDGSTMKFGWDKKTGNDLNSWDEDDDGVIFFEQEYKF
tara:strand:- start:2064 stop:2354 length:291 start_codon:yes stop_codon:yes gene_type:complete